MIPDEKYDVAIIGAGIGGLVCGCYLVKAGLRVLICEQHYEPGGCCTSFNRKGFIFDVGVHYLGSLREGGVLFNILKDLELLDRIKFITNDPTDRIITPDKTIFIRKDMLKTKEELISHFPKEKENINRFFDFITNKDFLYIYSKTKNLTFKQLLDNFFYDFKLKSILSILLGNLGLSPSQASALVSIVLYQEFILDGGYYPKGGIQVLPNLLVEYFKEIGGEILFSTKVKRIITINKKAIGIKIKDDKNIFSDFTVSNADATLTFKELLDCYCNENSTIDKLKVSSSAFILYLGLKKKIKVEPIHFTTWFFSDYDIDSCYSKNKIKDILDTSYFYYSFPSCIDESLAPNNKSIVRIFRGACFSAKSTWEHYKETISSYIINRTQQIFPDICDKEIEVKVIATPRSFHRYTLNRNGALFGWKAMPSQINMNVFPYKTSIQNLYLAGHWVTNGVAQSGVAVVAHSGKTTANAIIWNIKNR